MSSTYVPSTVVLYALTREGSVRAARFTWRGPAGVGLELLDERWGSRARTLLNEGVVLADGRRVTGGEVHAEAP